MNRRGLLKSVAGLTAGLLLPSTVQENAETARRYWALDSSMLGYGPWQYSTIWVSGNYHRDIARTRNRLVPGGYRSEVVWVDPDYDGTIVMVSEVNGVVTTSAWTG